MVGRNKNNKNNKNSSKPKKQTTTVKSETAGKKKFELFDVEEGEQKKDVAPVETPTHRNAITPPPSDPVTPLTLVSSPLPNKTPQAIAAEILGVIGADKFNRVITTLNKNEFHYNEHGVRLRFIKDNPNDKNNHRWIVVVGQEVRKINVPAAWWLIDKLAAETEERMFFSPGREGIRR